MVVRRGNNKKNTLRGGKGRDSLFGFGGNDILFGLAGIDRLLGGVGNDALDGGAGNDSLDGGAGKDKLVGGLGDDTYIVDNAGDRTIERAGQGIDTVRASVSWTLANNFEKLVLTGSRPINGTGNALNNDIVGNDVNNVLKGLGGNDGIIARSGNDLLDGGQGADFLIGGAGDDTYIVDNAVDLVSEKAINSEQELNRIQTDADLINLPDAGGIDLVQASVDYILPSDPTVVGTVENLELLGAIDLNGTGNGLNNFITGNSGKNSLFGAGGDDALDGGLGDDFLSGDSGNDVMRGGAGDDLLFGGGGLDAFLYATGAFFSGAALGNDSIGDFTRGQDLIALSKQTFGLSSAVGGGLTGNGDFARVASDSLAATSNALLVYSTLTGFLYFNPNRSAAGFGVPTADASFIFVSSGSAVPPSLTAQDFLVVS